MPKMDEGGFIIDYHAPPGTSLTETDRLLRQVEAILQKIPEVDTYSRRTGLGAGAAWASPKPTKAISLSASNLFPGGPSRP